MLPVKKISHAVAVTYSWGLENRFINIPAHNEDTIRSEDIIMDYILDDSPSTRRARTIKAEQHLGFM